MFAKPYKKLRGRKKIIIKPKQIWCTSYRYAVSRDEIYSYVGVVITSTGLGEGEDEKWRVLIFTTCGYLVVVS